MLNYPCKIGQESRCKSTGCEWKKAFNGYCGFRPSSLEIEFRERIKKVEFKPQNIKVNFEIINEENNPLRVLNKDNWISKIKVKL